MNMAEEREIFILTQEGYDNIKRQLAELEAVEKTERAQFADAVNDKAGGDDDDSDVAVEYDARIRKERTEEKIGHLRFILERAEIYRDINPDRIDVGERVTLWDFDDENVIQFDVVSSAEVTTRVDVNSSVKDASDASPIGQALLGKAVGDIVEVETPDGIMRYAVRKIEPIP
ncbi:MAG: hypothetical protein GC179_12075 [Anaerolineaceae bacterium]|nr:hypothetical protein [Anaerolineaceae bacterium]